MYICIVIVKFEDTRGYYKDKYYFNYKTSKGIKIKVINPD